MTAGTLEEAREALALVRGHPCPPGLAVTTTVGVHPTRCLAITQAPEAEGGSDAYMAQLTQVRCCQCVGLGGWDSGWDRVVPV